MSEPAEQRREVTLIFETDRRRNLDKRQLTLCEQVLGAFDAPLCHKLLRCKSGRLFERAREVILT